MALQQMEALYALQQRDNASAEVFKVGDLVEPIAGGQPGEIRAVFHTKAGKERFVVEHDHGLLHVYSAANIRPFAPPPEDQIQHLQEELLKARAQIAALKQELERRQ